jgi:3-hydroxymyristoyl/3-hydroxydecanoyl-(acyl carrier protein) dehydratase
LRFFDEPPAAGGAVSLDLRGSARLHMLDQIRWLALDGGRAGLGMIVGEKRVVAGDWFFRCHFYQDPVQPGSLGVEGLSQLLAVLAREKGLIARDAPYVAACVEWHYRGQVVPENVRVLSSVELTSVEEILSRDGRRCGVLLRGHGLLFCDSLKIYQTPGLRIFVPDEGCSIDNAQLDEAIPWL